MPSIRAYSLLLLGGLGSLATLPQSARAACLVDSLDTKVRERTHTRTDTLRLYVESGAPDCEMVRLTHPGSGRVTSARAKVLRGDTRNGRFGPDHLVRTAVDGELATFFALPGIRTGDIIELEIERTIEENHRWVPDAFGVPGWAALQWKGTAEPTAANVPTDHKGWFVERAALNAAGGGLAVQFGSPPAEAPGASTRGTASLRITLTPEASPPPGEPPVGQTTMAWRIPIGSSGAQAVAWPPDAAEPICQVEGAPEALVFPTDDGCVVREATEGAFLIAQWTLPRLQLAGEVGPDRRAVSESRASAGPADSGPLPAMGVLRDVGPIQVTMDAPGVTLRGQVLDSQRTPAIAGEGTLRFTVEGTQAAAAEGIAPRAGWWVTAVHGQPVLADRDAVVSAVARTALSASVPEPGLPARIRLRSGEETMIPDIQSLVREQMRAGLAPGQRSLQPRRLLDARKSTHGSEWELALVTARYLRQLRLDALPIPVRPPTMVPADPSMPAGFDFAVVRVRLADGSDLWLDPSCPVCAPGELRPFLWSGQTLSEAIEQLPAAPLGRKVETITISADGTETVDLLLEGTAALQMRLDLLQHPSTERIAALEGLLDGKLDSHTGLAGRGEPIQLVATRTGVLDPVPPKERFSVPDAAVVRLPWVGEHVRQYRVPADISGVLLAPADEAEVAGTGLRWSRTLGVEPDGTRVAHEVLQMDKPVVWRDSFIALRDRMSDGTPEPLPIPADSEAPRPSTPEDEAPGDSD